MKRLISCVHIYMDFTHRMYAIVCAVISAAQARSDRLPKAGLIPSKAIVVVYTPPLATQYILEGNTVPVRHHVIQNRIDRAKWDQLCDEIIYIINNMREGKRFRVN